MRTAGDAARLVAGVGILVASGVLVQDGRVGPVEEGVFQLFNDLPGVAYVPVWVIMQLGQLLAIPVVAVAALLSRRRRLALTLTLSGLATYMLAKQVKAFVQRGRPGALLEDVTLRGAHAGGLGFVSGHAADAVALAAVASPYLGRRGRALAWGLAAAVGAARVYVGAHLPLDITGGAGLGYAVAAAVHLVFGRPEAPAPEGPRTGH